MIAIGQRVKISTAFTMLIMFLTHISASVISAPQLLDSMVYVYQKKLSEDDVRRSEVIMLIKEALKRTEDTYGPFVLKPASVAASVNRTAHMIKNGGEVTVAWLDTTKQLEDILLPILIPIQKGIVGYRILLIRKENQEKFYHVKNIDDLRSLKNGIGLGWINEDVMKLNDLPYEVTPSYEGLFRMLSASRIDYFSRGVVEVFAEFDARSDTHVDLSVEKSMAFFYHKPSYLFTSRNHPKLNARLREGLEELMEDGTFDKMFCEANGDSIRRARLDKRTIIKLDSNLLLSTAPKDSHFWFQPENPICPE